MAERRLTGSGIGVHSFETEEGIEFAARMNVTYDCHCGHASTLPFSVEAEVPKMWPCRCGGLGVLRDLSGFQAPEGRKKRSHWDMVLERRTVADLELLLEERLTLLRERRLSANAAV
ncbi:MAG: RNA polymerase-binding protein RbpA [Bifidobacteriaceae bacterium]|jgi:hypothetical protein|nr:RNA polymerase-binding protein RbpA [Bifidobacteriaceae bacterium]